MKNEQHEKQDTLIANLSREAIYQAIQLATNLEKHLVEPISVLDIMQDKDTCLILTYCWETYNRQEALDIITNARIDRLIEERKDDCIYHMTNMFRLNTINEDIPEEEY